MSKLPKLPLVDPQQWLMNTYCLSSLSKGRSTSSLYLLKREIQPGNSDVRGDGPVFPPISRRPRYEDCSRSQSLVGRERRRKRQGGRLSYYKRG